jgi:hypothetical protein
MPRYFFDIGDHRLLIHDQPGEELASWQEARDMALAVLPDLGRDALRGDGEHTVFVAIRNESNRVIFKATLVLTTRLASDA